jgi:hypothetical protein
MLTLVPTTAVLKPPPTSPETDYPDRLLTATEVADTLAFFAKHGVTREMRETAIETMRSEATHAAQAESD